MRRREFDYEKLERPTPTKARPEVKRGFEQQESGLANTLTAAGNRAMARAMGPRMLAREPSPAAPAPTSADADPAERTELTDEEKHRIRLFILGPTLAAAKQLEQGEQADVRSVVRHLKPVAKFEMNIEWPEAVSGAMNTMFSALVDIVLELDTLSKDHRQAVADTLHRWKKARDHLRTSARLASADAAKGQGPPSAGAVGDPEALRLIADEIDASIKDLEEAPKTQEGYRAVAQNAFPIIGQLAPFSDVASDHVDLGAAMAEGEIETGLAILVPLHMNKAEVISRAVVVLVEMAMVLSTITGHTEPEQEKKDDEPHPPPSPAATSPPPDNPKGAKP